MNTVTVLVEGYIKAIEGRQLIPASLRMAHAMSRALSCLYAVTMSSLWQTQGW